MARKYYGTFKSFNNTTWRVEIHDAPTGSATAGTELKLAGEGFTLDREGEGSKWHESRVLSSRVTARWVMPDLATLNAFIGIQTEAENYLTMVVWRGSDLFFVGRVLADQLNRLRESIDGNPVIEITAVDGLELLTAYNVEPDWFTTDFIDINILFKKCLEQLDLSDYWAYLGKTDYYFFDAQSMYAADASRKGIDKLRVNVRTFLQTYDPFQDIKWIDLTGLYNQLNMVNCRDAIQQVCEIFNTRFMHANGGYWLTDVTSYADTTMPYRRYDSSMVYKAASTYSHRQALGTLPARPQWAAKPNLYYQPAIRQCIIDTERINIAYTSRYRGNASINAYELVSTEIPTGSTPNAAPFKFKILVRFAYPANSTKNYEQAKIIHRAWLEDSSGNKKQLDANGYWVSTSFVDSTKETIDIKNQQGNWITYKFERQCTTAPAGFDKLKISIDQVEVIAPMFSKIGGWRTGGTIRDYVAFWGSIDVAFATFSDYQNPDFVFKVTEEFTASAANLINSTQIELKPRYYYSGNKYGVGNIWTNDGFKWVIADEFFGGWDSITKGTPTKMLGVGLASLYADFVPVVRGTWVDSGSLDLVKSLYFDSYTWVLNGVSFNPRQDQWEGEWLGVLPVYTNTTTTGEGLRIGNAQDDIVRDRLNLIETQINNYQSMISDMPDTILEYLTNEADGAPTAQPTQNIIWETQLRYDDSTEQVVWHLQEHGAPISYAVGTHTLTNGYELVICDSADGNVVVNLPDADESRGKKYIFIKTNTNHTVTIDAGTFLINDATTTTLGSKYESKTVMSDGSKWFIVGTV